jgi:hypothetical protein
MLRQCELALADLYPLVVRVPSLGRSPAMTTPEGIDQSPIPNEGDLESTVAGRLPQDLYWAALRPLTWEDVANTGTTRMAHALVSIGRVLTPILWEAATASSNSLLYAFSLDKDDLAQLTLAALTILHEVVTDLEAYEKA